MWFVSQRLIFARSVWISSLVTGCLALRNHIVCSTLLRGCPTRLLSFVRPTLSLLVGWTTPIKFPIQKHTKKHQSSSHCLRSICTIPLILGAALPALPPALNAAFPFSSRRFFTMPSVAATTPLAEAMMEETLDCGGSMGWFYEGRLTILADVFRVPFPSFAN